MCNLSQGFIEKGREEGRNEGRKEGAVKASVDAIRRFSKKFNIPIEEAYQTQAEGLTRQQARIVRSRLNLK